MNILVLGLNPSAKHSSSKSLETLWKWLDFLEVKYVSFDNIYPKYGKVIQNQIDKRYIREISSESDRIIALGQTVSSTLSSMGIDHFRLPHPSGLNRQLNNKKFLNQKLSRCLLYLELGDGNDFF